ncbi:MAG: DUF3365 domain-containing protein [Desulfobulbaceae bacterium]|uniref:histidine kinase n=1 Tax=Candidatus Desulfatifera sulfidica TaxID=2841691 RepID=A0A8J6TA12_9BACT|nr:DUF3365 domain-containing protein [Candidatus Desulfatifera sulfidica]
MSHNSDGLLKKIPVRRGGVLLFTLWTITIGASFAWNFWQENKAVLNQARSEAKGLFHKDETYRRWAALHGGVYVPVTDYTRPSPFLAHVSERDITTPSGRNLTLINPAYMTRQVLDMTHEHSKVYGRITSLQPIHAGNTPDAWEKKALQSFENNGDDEVSIIEVIEGERYMRFIRPFYVEDGCLRCHEQQGYKLDDVRGGISTAVPLDHYYALRQKHFISLSIWHLSLYLFGVAVIVGSTRLLGTRIRENETISKELNLDRERFRSLLALADLPATTEEELIHFALDETIRLTESDVGYFHLYDEETETIRLFAWCQKVMAQCHMAEQNYLYPLAKAGVWADCVRTGRPAIHNDYAALPNKKELPEGHLPIKRHMSTAIMDGKRIVALSGVGNKEKPYNKGDEQQLALYMTRAWEIIRDKQSKDTIKEQEAGLRLFRNLIDQSYDAIFIISPREGRFLDVNGRACEMLGYSREELLQLGVLDIDVGLPKDFSMEAYVKELRQTANHLMESVHKRKDGTTFPVELNIRLIVHENTEYIIAAARDIKERQVIQKKLQQHQRNLEKLVEERTATLAQQTVDLEKSQTALQHLVEDLNEANEKLKELDQLKSMFIASMSHELRTPLNSVIGFSSILLNQWQGPLNEEQEKNLAIIQRAGKHLLALINDVIDISKIEAGALPTECETFDLQPLIEEAVDTVRAEAEGKGLVIFQETLSMEIHTDRRRLLQCLLNLLSNGVKFTDDGSITVKVVFDDSSQFVTIIITDTGIGISREDVPKLFQPFARIAPPGSSIYPGTGLGLYLTKKLAMDILQGDILLESSPGKGSIFTIRIPTRINT